MITTKNVNINQIFLRVSIGPLMDCFSLFFLRKRVATAICISICICICICIYNIYIHIHVYVYVFVFVGE